MSVLPGPLRNPRLAEKICRRLARNFPAFFAERLRQPVLVVGFNNSAKSTMMRALQQYDEIGLYPDEGNSELWFPGFFPWLASTVEVAPVWYNPECFVEAVVQSRDDRFLQARAYMGAYQWLMGYEYLVNDSGMLAAILPDIAPVFPDARYIHIRRDGRVVSYLAARKEWSQMMRSPAKYKAAKCEFDFQSVLRRVAKYWAFTMSQVDEVAAANPGAVYTVCYESWCLEPDKTVRDIADFLACDGNQLALQWGQPIENMNELVLAEYSTQDKTTVIDAIGPVLAAKGHMWDDCANLQSSN